MELDGIPTQPAEVSLLKQGANQTLLKVILREGRNRQIRRVADALGHPVLDLQRTNPPALIRTGVISGLQQLLEYGYFHADPHPGNLFALSGQTGDLGHVAYVDFGMMDSISDSDRLTLTGAVVHLTHKSKKRHQRSKQTPT